MDQQRIIDHFKDSDVDIIHILQAQKIAAGCLKHMEAFLRPGLTRDQIHQECASYMNSLGSQGWWIHNDPALILFGDLSNYSGHEPPNYEGLKVSENDLITIDVAPMIQSGWGDMARSFVMEEGKIIPWRQSQNQEIIEGMEMELKLHRLFMDSVNEKATFEDLHHLIDEEVKKAGYCNCDYHGNYGHTIENDAKDRVTIDKGVSLAIAAYDKPITFEPHICKMNGRFGLKHEIMYAFIDGKMEVIG